MAPTTGRGADLPAASVQIGPSAYPVFYAARKTGPSRRRTLLSVAVAVGCERATTAAAERWRHARQRHPSRPLSPRLPPRRSPRFFFFFFLLRESQRHSSFAKISRRRLRGWAFQFRAASSRLGCRNVFTRIRRRRRRCYACARHFLLNGEMWCWFRNRLSRFLF